MNAPCWKILRTLPAGGVTENHEMHTLGLEGELRGWSPGGQMHKLLALGVGCGYQAKAFQDMDVGTIYRMTTIVFLGSSDDLGKENGLKWKCSISNQLESKGSRDCLR